MKGDKSKITNQFLVIFVVWISVSSCVAFPDIGSEDNGIQARQSAIQKPIATNTTTAKPSANLNTNLSGASSNINSSLFVIISTPATTPSNVISALNAKPAQDATTARPIATTAKPIATTTKSNMNATVSTGTTTKKPATTVPVPGCPTGNIMATKTGFFPADKDPCSFVSCIQTTTSLLCALIKCDPGQAFSPQTGRCAQSNLCPVKPK